MDKYKRRYYGDSPYSERYYERWTKEEDVLVLNKSVTDKDLSRMIGRSINSIQRRRWQLKKG